MLSTKGNFQSILNWNKYKPEFFALSEKYIPIFIGASRILELELSNTDLQVAYNFVHRGSWLATQVMIGSGIDQIPE